MLEMFSEWQAKAEEFRSGKITKEEYDNGRYNYPCLDNSGSFKKIENL